VTKLCAAQRLILGVTLLLLPARAQSAGGIELALQGVSQRYCSSGDNDIGIVQIRARFQYTNSSEHAVWVLRRRHGIAYVRLKSADPDARDALPISHSFTDVPPDLLSVPDLALSDFIRLGPGETFALSETLSFPFLRAGHVFSGRIAKDGRYMVNASVALWPWTKEAAMEIERKLGTSPIWLDPVWSKPVEIEVRSNTREEQCRPE
jgi:hypothetical protein